MSDQAQLARERVRAIRQHDRQRGPNASSAKRAATPEYLRTLIEIAAYTQAGAAEQLGIDHRTMRRYLLGERPIPYLVAFALEQLAAAS